jgi:signal transduction histidine kinase/CheY-like chemotaxis protein
MFIRDYLSSILISTVLCGLFMAGYFAWDARTVQELQYDATEQSLVLRELRQIGEHLDASLVLADLSIGAGETYSAQAASDGLRKVGDRVSVLSDSVPHIVSPQAARQLSSIADEINDFMRSDLNALRGHGDDRGGELAAFDRASAQLVDRYTELEETVESFAGEREAAYRELVSGQPRRLLLIVSTYLLVTALIVLWCQKKIARPLEELAVSAHNAMTFGDHFAPPATTVQETRELGTQLQELVSHLENMVTQRTRALDDKRWALEREIAERIDTERALVEAKAAAEESNSAKSDFLSVMSHELRTPMNAVLGALTLVRESGLNEEQESYVRIADESGQALLTLLGDILSLSKLDSEGVSLSPDRLSLSELLDSTVGILHSQAADKGLELRWKMEPGMPDDWDGDFDRIRQVLMNLVVNAIKFTESGCIDVSAQLEDGADGKPHVLLRVVDTGVGIPSDKLLSIFDNFSQIDESLSREHAGVGLGLSICKRLVSAMGGVCGVESQQGEGSSFWFTVPRTPESELPEISVTENPSQALASPVSELRELPRDCASMPAKVLIVEDSQVNQFIAATIVGKAGHQVEVVDSGPGALSKLAEQDFDVIFMDVQMPGMDGIETTRRIRQTRGPAGQVHIIAFTANVLDTTISACMAAGMDDFTAKPVVAGEVLEKIERVMAAKLAGRSAGRAVSA